MQPARTPTDTPTALGRESQRRLLFLLGLAAVLGGLFAWDRWADWSGSAPAGAPQRAPIATAVEKSKPMRAGAEADAGSAPTAAGGSHPLAGLPLADLSDTVRRPLFERTRRPVEPPKMVVPT